MDPLLVQIIKIIPWLFGILCAVIAFFINRHMSETRQDIKWLEVELDNVKDRYVSQNHLDDKIGDVKDLIRGLRKDILDRLSIMSDDKQS